MGRLRLPLRHSLAFQTAQPCFLLFPPFHRADCSETLRSLQLADFYLRHCFLWNPTCCTRRMALSLIGTRKRKLRYRYIRSSYVRSIGKFLLKKKPLVMVKIHSEHNHSGSWIILSFFFFNIFKEKLLYFLFLLILMKQRMRSKLCIIDPIIPASYFYK